MEEQRSEQENNRSANKLHIFITSFLTLLSMVILDVYLVRQNHGSRRIGVSVMLVINELCHLLALRYIGYWVGSEVLTNKRGWSIVAWFLFIVIYDIKMYFVLQHIWTACAPIDVVIDPKTLKSTNSLMEASIYKNGTGNSENSVISMRVDQPKGCDYSLLEKKLLNIFQAVLLPGLYLALVGADHMRTLTDFRNLEEVKMRIFWVVVDMLDVLQLQSSMWETNTHQFPYISATVLYFYCYVLLIVLPPISMAEMSKKEGDFVPHKMVFYLIASVILVNIGTTTIRCLLLFYYKFNLVSSIFLAKNTLCLGMQLTKAIQFEQIKKREKNEEDFENRSVNDLSNGEPGFGEEFLTDPCDITLHNDEEYNFKQKHCTEHGLDGQKLSFGNFDATESYLCEGSLIEKGQVEMSDISTNNQVTCLSESNATSNEATIPRSSSLGKPSTTYSSFSKETQLKEKKRVPRGKYVGVLSATSESDSGSSFTSSSKTKSKTLSSKGLYRFSEPVKLRERNYTTLDNRSSIRSDVPFMPASPCIVTPPTSFNDFPIAKSATVDRKRVQMQRPNILATSLQNEIAHFTDSLGLPRNISTRRSSVSLDGFNTSPVTVQMHSNEKCKCKSNTSEPPVNNYDNTNMSESDLSDVNVPLPPPCVTLERTLPRKQVSHDAQSDCSTTV